MFEKNSDGSLSSNYINLNFIVFSADFCIVKSMFRIRKSSDEGIIDAIKFAKIVIRM